MCGSGAAIGIAATITATPRVTTRKAHHRALTACSAGAVGSTMRGTAVLLIVTAAVPTTGTSTTACASLSKFNSNHHLAS